MFRDREWLRSHYEGEQMNMQQMATYANCSTATIHDWLHRFDVPIRNTASKLRDRKWLYHQYVELKKTQQQVADKAKCSRSAVLGWLKRHNITVRTQSEAGKLRAPCSNETRRRLSEAIKNLPPRTEKQCRAISERMRHHWQDPIARVHHLEAMRDKVWPLRGEGIYPPEFNMEFKQMIRQRDKHSYAICRFPGNSTHHIDYDKNNTIEENCVILCRVCHSVTNFNRDYWRLALQKVLVARAGRHLFGV